MVSPFPARCPSSCTTSGELLPPLQSCHCHCHWHHRSPATATTQETPQCEPQSVPCCVSPQIPAIPTAPTPEILNKAALSPLTRVSVPRLSPAIGWPWLIIPQVFVTSFQLKSPFFWCLCCQRTLSPLQPSQNPKQCPRCCISLGFSLRSLLREGQHSLWAVTQAGDTPKSKEMGDIQLLMRLLSQTAPHGLGDPQNHSSSTPWRDQHPPKGSQLEFSLC